MTAAVPERTTRPSPLPCLAAAPSSGPLISALFALAVVLFVIGLIAL